MRAISVLGWVAAPFFMLPATWSKLPGAGKIWGSLWSAVLLGILLVNLLPLSSGGNPAQKVQAKAVRTQTEQALPANVVVPAPNNN